MALQIEQSCNGTPQIEDYLPTEKRTELTPEQIANSIAEAAAMAKGKSNVWSEGLKKTLNYQPDYLARTVARFDILEMSVLTMVLERNRTHIVTYGAIIELVRENLDSVYENNHPVPQIV